MSQNQNKRKKKFVGTSLQRKLLILIFASAVIPAAIIAISLYYLVFNLLAYQMGIPEFIAYNLLPVVHKVNLIIFIAVPISLFLIWLVAIDLSNRIAGPIYRMERELNARLTGEKSGPISVRKKDEIRPLVEKINKLIQKG
jgi:nitrogen fixation/metabolism regulation signal transduction histidine kinase